MYTRKGREKERIIVAVYTAAVVAVQWWFSIKSYCCTSASFFLAIILLLFFPRHPSDSLSFAGKPRHFRGGDRWLMDGIFANGRVQAAATHPVPRHRVSQYSAPNNMLIKKKKPRRTRIYSTLMETSSRVRNLLLLLLLITHIKKLYNVCVQYIM